jgi:hypothetical protein
LYSPNVPLFDTCVSESPVMLANAAAAVPQESVVAIIRILFVDARPTPVSCSKQVAVNVQSVAASNTLTIAKPPTAYE